MQEQMKRLPASLTLKRFHAESTPMTKPTADRAEASPTKQFFVSMLTRDINLADAILDLLDNCLDGALRLANGNSVDYALHFVRIELTVERFSIEDNCGGIPREVAKNYAFKMGREPDDERDSDTETIGMYGVGMKRAIFKMGREALVRTRYGNDTFEVPITSAWLNAKGWDPLPINEPTEAREKLAEPGTVIHVHELYEGVSRHFANEAFENEVRTAISEHFTMFLQLGLKVELNGKPVEPVLVEVLVSKRDDGPAPFVFQKTIDDVLVSITVGLNTGRSLGTDNEDDAQFAIITGIIEFRSKRADKLPVTTTKRALDTSSNVWLESLVKMKEGMRVWISYTNQWKNHPRADQSNYWEDARALPLKAAIAAVVSRNTARRTGDQVEFNPQKARVLPEPPGKTPSSRRIVFSRPVEEVRLVSKMLFDVDDEKPGIIGDKCFELTLTKAKKRDG
jgi:hypothetical protein